MDERLYGLMEAAEDQQKAAEKVIQEMEAKLKELEALCAQIPQVLNKWHSDLDGMVSKATQETLRREIARLDAPIRANKQTAYANLASAVLVLIAACVVLWHSMG